MDNLKNKKSGIFQEFSYKLFLFLSGIIFSFAAVGQTTDYFTTVGTTNWTVPADVYSITVECWGGGGGGGAARVTCSCQQTSAGGGGKGGMYSRTTLSVTPSTIYQVTVGDGGAAGNSSAGGAGGKSALSLSGTDVAWASGGNGGAYSVSVNNQAGGTTYAAPGTGSGTVYNGGDGAPGRKTTTRQAGGGGGGGGGTGGDGTAASNPANGAGGPNNTTSPGGAGGNADGGAGGAGGNNNNSNNGTAGTAGAVRGGGGGGARRYSNTTNGQHLGGAGGRGEVRITYTVSPLPVTLSSFNADCTGSTTYIAWTTASEQNSDYFTVESSRDGEQWSEVETVMGAGTTHSTTHYSILDNVAASYYRLTQTDFDGKTTMYPVIFVDCNAKKNENGLVVYPNPSNDGSVAVAVNAQEELGESTIFLHSINGQIVASHNLNVLSGTNVIQFTDIERGTYLVTVNGNGKNALKPVKLVVQ